MIAEASSSVDYHARLFGSVKKQSKHPPIWALPKQQWTFHLASQDFVFKPSLIPIPVCAYSTSRASAVCHTDPSSIAWLWAFRPWSLVSLLHTRSRADWSACSPLEPFFLLPVKPIKREKYTQVGDSAAARCNTEKGSENNWTRVQMQYCALAKVNKDSCEQRKADGSCWALERRSILALKLLRQSVEMQRDAFQSCTEE